MNDEDFKLWKQKKNKATLFFDGAMQKNLGAIGACGVLFDLRGNNVESFS